MHLLKAIALLAAAPLLSSAVSENHAHVQQIIKSRLRLGEFARAAPEPVKAAPAGDSKKPRYLNSKSKKFAVNGTGIPLIDWDVGESYAGVLPISNDPNETRKLYFWFFPSQAVEAHDEIGIWLNGGPGCSSMGGLVQENGPFLWQAGSPGPTNNPYAFNRLTNYVWVDQPVGAGFSVGQANITDENGVADQFKGFWKNFVDTFGLQGNKVYLSGESYAGQYVPYIANAFLEANDTKYFNVKGIAVNDPIIGDGNLQFSVPIVPFVDYWSNVLGIDRSAIAKMREINKKCGMAAYLDTYFTFPPPKGIFPPPPSYACSYGDYDPDRLIYAANPCFNPYHITDSCPTPYDLNGGLSSTTDSTYFHATVYFQRPDVLKAINAPPGSQWTLCGGDVFLDPGDLSLGPALDGSLTNVIEKTNNVIIGAGNLDYLLPANGTLIVFQNLTWGGDQGFHEYPSTPIFIPSHKETNPYRTGPSGNIGVWRQERGLTYFNVQLSGHMLPQYSATGGYRIIQVMLGRVKDLSSTDALF